MDVETPDQPKSKVKAWMSAMRLRTLPLALASTLLGAFVAMEYVTLDLGVLLLTISTTILLQVNSNLANDYGDFSHGTDNETRIGPERALQSGVLHADEMRRAIVICSVLSLISGVALILLTPLSLLWKGLLLVLGLAAIYASIRYTAGKNPYGYRGLGDVSVMAFFGLLGVLGSFVCQTGMLLSSTLLPAIALGAFSTGVLNVNNTRDLEADRNAGKITLAVRMGPRKARTYHVVLLLVGMLAMVIYALLHFEFGWDWLFISSYPLFLLNALKVWRGQDPKQLDPLLKQLALSTFLFTLLVGVGLAL
jgi:1,4-dihydroxy-2-naphthoate octaprenyltransferase